jgi:hypothetical protein
MVVHGLVLVGALTGHWHQIFERLYVQALTPSFADLRTIPAAAASAAAGMDPLLQNPFEPWGRPMNYPRFWIGVGAFIGPGHGVVILGVFFAAVFSVACAWIVATQKTLAGGVAVFLVAVSASTWLAIERGNNDLLVFGCIALALYLPWRWRGVFLGLAAVLKIFPLAAVLVKSLWQRSGINLAVAAIVLVYLVVTFGDIQKIRATTEVSGEHSFGVPSVVLLLAGPGSRRPPAVIYGVFGGAALLAAAAGLMLPLPSRPTAFEEESLLIAAAIFLFCFVVSSNWDYRLIFVIFLIPYFVRATGSMLETLTGFAAVAAMLIACNFGVLQAAWGDAGIFVNLAGKSLLYVLVVYSAVRVVTQLEDVKALSTRLRPIGISGRHRDST